MRGVIVEVSSRKFGVPFECPCCGAAPDADITVRATTDTRRLDMPYCKRCLAHVHAWDGAGVRAAGVAVVGIVAGAIVAPTVSVPIGIAIIVASIVAGSLLRSRGKAKAKRACGASCATPAVALTYMGWNGTTSSFQFESPTFAARFAEMNTSILANETVALRKLLEG